MYHTQRSKQERPHVSLCSAALCAPQGETQDMFRQIHAGRQWLFSAMLRADCDTTQENGCSRAPRQVTAQSYLMSS